MLYLSLWALYAMAMYLPASAGNTRALHVVHRILVLLAAYHASVLSFYRFEAWASFARWFAALPLS
jgi:hypothetical protein